MRVLVDSYAWVEYFEATRKGYAVKEIIEDENNEVFCSALTVSEIVSKSERKGQETEAIFDALKSSSKILSVDDALAKRAGKKHAEMRKKHKNFGLVDAFILAHSEKIKARILSGDKHFKGMKNVVFIGD